MRGWKFFYIGLLVVALVLSLSAWMPGVSPAAQGKGNVTPKFVVDPFWPKPLPNNWLVGQVAGVAVDKYDHIWIIQRPSTLTTDEAGAEQEPPLSDCCYRAPSVMTFDREGNLLQAWGGSADPGFIPGRCDPAAGCEWPANEHGIYVDENMNVWIAGNGGNDHQVLKFSADGTFLLQIGKAGMTGGSDDTNGAPNGTPLLGRPADTEYDPQANEVYIADGYLNHRVIVVDADTGLYKRHWGAYGHTPVEPYLPDEIPAYEPNQAPSEFFRNPVHCVRIADDGLVYVCDRVNDRMQVFHKDGTFVTEFFVETDTLGPGSVWDIDLSPDSRQLFLFNADGSNNYVWTLLRNTGEILSHFGRNGRNAGQFHWVHNIAVDSHGDLYTAEVDTGKRAQRFIRRGFQPVP